MKGMVWSRSITCLAALIPCVAFAQSSVPRYDKLIQSFQTVGVLGKDLAGDSTNFYTGATSFSSTDLSIPGNNSLPVAVGRSYAVEPDHMVAHLSSGTHPVYAISVSKQYAFGDWELDIPYISGTFTQEFGWQLDSTTPANRCSVIGQVKADGSLTNAQPKYQSEKGSSEPFWYGNSLHLPGEDQTLLIATEAASPRPASGGPYHWVTNRNWWVSCLPSTANNAGGEGFLAIAPDGTKYWFDWMSRRPTIAPYNTESLSTDPNGGPPYKTYYTWSQDMFLLPTRIEDRFGNWVSYAYSGDAFAKLQSISSSDGRNLTLTYNAQGFVETVSDGTRVVTYSYSGSSLSDVHLADGSSWTYGLQNASYSNDSPAVDPNDPCGYPNANCFGWPVINIETSAYVIHPSGARVDFTFRSHFQWQGQMGWAYPVGISEKTISGPGLVPQKWYYAFGPSKDDAQAQCTAGACPTRIWTDEVSPDYRVTRRMFGLKEAEDQGLLIQQLRGQIPVSTTTTTTATATSGTRLTHSMRMTDLDLVDDTTVVTLTNTSTTVTGPPEFYEEADYFYRIGQKLGANPLVLGSQAAGQSFWTERHLPVSQRKTYVQGESFTWQANTWDGFDRPLSVSKVSTLNAGKSETTEYQDDLGKWVLGLVKKKTVSGVAVPVEETAYDSNLLPWKLYSSGKLQQTLTYNADGTLATVSDGRDGAGAETTVTLSDWKRGIPQTIRYPATPESPSGSTQSAVVNNVGWIESVTDENGYTTSYGYDPVGRLNRITYPVNDTVAWNDTTMTFAPYLAGAELGIPAGHWKQMVTTGNAQKVTYFDALWRPLVEEAFDSATATTKANTLSQVVKRYDGDGRLIFQSTAQRGITDFAAVLQGTRTGYDALGRPARIEQDSELGAPAVTTIEYLAGFKRKTTNPRLQSTVESFQSYEAPSFDAPVQIDAPESVRSSIVRDVFGKPTQITRGSGS